MAEREDSDKFSKPLRPQYRGRFAPSPSGPLHLGSLVCALASYLDAKANKGIWLVRIEDIDPPREQVGATDLIINTLLAHGLEPDEPILFQSERGAAYREYLSLLREKGLSYRCVCTRKRLRELQGMYDGQCRSSGITEENSAAVRLNLDACKHLSLDKLSRFNDKVYGAQDFDLLASGDFVVHRKDGLFAYQLAVVVDDIFQGITHIVRGADLLDTTSQQRLLFSLFGHPTPDYAHIPLVVDENGKKLSKQNHASPVNNESAKENILLACAHLGIEIDPKPQHSVNTVLEEALAKWKLPNGI